MNSDCYPEVDSRFCVRRPWISTRCSSWTRLLTARCCAVSGLIQTAQLCAVLDKVVDLPVIVQVQQFVQFLDKVVDMPIVVQRQALLVQTYDVEQIVASCHRF